MTTSLLFIGDVHLGRRPDRLAVAGLDPRRLSPAVAWQRAVDLAIQGNVAAVVLAGDLVDEERDRFEAYRYLERGVRRLVEHEIVVLAVAGNHDGMVLPRLAERIPGFNLVGQGGTWELLSLDAPTPVDVLGWSFPAAHHRQSPLDSAGLTRALERRRPGVACLGVLHADLDASASPYAPVSREDLAAHNIDGWFLGHVHRPDALAPPRPMGYLGSLVGLRRSELGQRGAWMVTVKGPGRLDCSQVQVGPLRWETVEVDVSDVPDDDGAEDALHAAVERSFRAHRAADTSLEDPQVAAVGCRVALVGRTSTRRRLLAYLSRKVLPDLCFDLGQQRWATIEIRDNTRPALDLEALASQHTPVGQVARLLLDLEAGGGDAADLLEVAGRALEPFSEGHWSLGRDRWPVSDPGRLMLRAGYRLLDALVAQGAGGEPA